MPLVMHAVITSRAVCASGVQRQNTSSCQPCKHGPARTQAHRLLRCSIARDTATQHSMTADMQGSKQRECR